MNSIELFKSYAPFLDEVMAAGSLTAKLDGDPALVQAGSNPGELMIPRFVLSGLAAYDRSGGYADGDIALTLETVPVGYDRGRMFTVDAVDNEDTAGVAFGQLAGEFIRSKVVPEVDAFRFAAYASYPGVASASGDLADGPSVVAALRAAATAMDEAEVPPDERHLFITPTLLGYVEDMDTTKSKDVFLRFQSVTMAPQTRFYTAVRLLDGRTSGQEAGGFAKAAGAKNLNFMIVSRPAVIQFSKHVDPKVITPEMNPSADAWKFGYRYVSVADVYANKAAGIYVHKAA